jgi:hypothetical protein
VKRWVRASVVTEVSLAVRKRLCAALTTASVVLVVSEAVRALERPLAALSVDTEVSLPVRTSCSNRAMASEVKLVSDAVLDQACTRVRESVVLDVSAAVRRRA